MTLARYLGISQEVPTPITPTKATRTINKQLQTDETSSWRALRYSEETRETWWAKTNDGPLEEHRKHLPALPLAQSRAAGHQEGPRRCGEKEGRRPQQSHRSRGLRPALSRTPTVFIKTELNRRSHPESPLPTLHLKDGAASAVRPAATPMPALHDPDAAAPCHTGDWSRHGSAPTPGP